MGVTHGGDLRAKIYIYIYIHVGKIHTEELNLEGDIRWKVHMEEKQNIHMEGTHTAEGTYSWRVPYEVYNIRDYLTAIYQAIHQYCQFDHTLT